MTSLSKARILSIPFYLWFFLLMAAPVLIVLLTGFLGRSPLGEVENRFTLEAYTTLFDPLYLKVLLSTLGFALANTVCCLLIAFPVAFYISRISAEKRIWILSLILIPFWTSFLIRILAFMDVLRMKPLGLDLVYTAPGIVAAMVYNYVPAAILPLYASMEKIDDSWIEAATDLGASKRQVLTQVLLPLTAPAIFTAALFVFIPSLGEFLIPDLIGGGQNFLVGSFLQNQFLTARNWPLGAAAISMVLVSTLFCLVLIREKETT